MKKFRKKVIIMIAAVLIFLSFGIVMDKLQLRNNMIRLHVIADSNSAEDQHIKLKVRDAVLAVLQVAMEDSSDVYMAKDYILMNIPQLESAANQVLKDAGFSEQARVSLVTEEYPCREYETFSLPSGVYQSLKVVIGSGEGKNWWCVVFPTLCKPATVDAFREESESTGISRSLSNTLCADKKYEIRFFLLDCLGKIENFFHFG